jgi:hypothetical protein
MMYARVIGITLGASSLAGCAHQAVPRHTDQLVAVPVVIGALKCAFAEALVRETETGQIQRLRGRVASGVLTLKIVDENKVGAGVEGQSAGPFILSFQGATGSILPSLSGSVTRTDTISTDIYFRYLLDGHDTRACDIIPKEQRDEYGFSRWLAKLVTGLDVHARVSPPGQVDKISYSSDFAVVRSGQSDVDFNIVFLSASASAAWTRNDVQSLKFTIAPKSKENPPPVPGGGSGVGPSLVPRTPLRDPPPNIGPLHKIPDEG